VLRCRHGVCGSGYGGYIYNGIDSKKARKALPHDLHQKAQDKLTIMELAESLEDLHEPPSNHLEALDGDRKGQHSIRINDKYRICFRWVNGEALDVEIVDYH
jgi:toxin HigB-1